MADHGARRFIGLACAAHFALTVALFWRVLTGAGVPYLRDVSSLYYPDYVFVASSLRHGTWPLWNPTADAGAPFLNAYPIELLLLGLAGARATLAMAPPLHVWIAMCGVTLLALHRGTGRWGAWLAGAVFGLSGYLQSSLNLFELSHGAALAPLVILAYLRLWDRPDARRAAVLALLAALQVSTLAGEVMMQTACFAFALTPRWPTRRRLCALAGAGLMALAIAAPVFAGMRALVEDGARARGFAPEIVLSWSVSPAVLAEAVWPFFLGDPHTMTNVGYWGQPFFPDGYPYLLSLYLGPIVLGLAASAGPAGRRLWALVAAGLLLAFGAHGPLAGAFPWLLPHFRAPVKFLFVPTLAVALLAGLGLERAALGRRAAALAIGVPASALLAGGLLWSLVPRQASAWAGAVWPSLARPQAVYVMYSIWPAPLLATGTLGVLAAAVLASRRARTPLVAVCVAADLVLTNGAVESAAGPRFYDLGPEVRRLVSVASAIDPAARWFSFGSDADDHLRWAPRLLKQNHDVPLFHLNRQTLWARTKGLDGLDGAFDEDRSGWAPPGSTFTVEESSPRRYRSLHERLRNAGVRWVLSFASLPSDLVTLRDRAFLGEIAEPLGLYEVQDSLARVFWVADCEVVPSLSAETDPSRDPAARALLRDAPPGPACGATPPGSRGAVRWTRIGPHHIRLEPSGDRGFVVALEGFHRHWRATAAGGARVPLLRAGSRYWGVPVSGADGPIDVRFDPPWRMPSLVACAAGLLAACLLVARRPRSAVAVPAADPASAAG